MTINRRDMLRWAGIGGGAALVSASALAADLPGLVLKPLTGEPLVPVATPPAPAITAPPALMSPAGINPALFARAKAALDRNGGQVRYRDKIGIVDFNRSSSESRFHVVDLASGQVDSHFVAHGRGSDQGHTGWLEHFSNAVGSNATSNGAYVTGDFYQGKYGLSMKVAGLDWTNSNAMERAIVVHQAWYAEPDIIAVHGKLGRSEGCFAFGRTSHFEVMRALGPGHLIYADKLA